MFVSDAFRDLTDAAVQRQRDTILELFSSHRGDMRFLMDRHERSMDTCRLAYGSDRDGIVAAETAGLRGKLGKSEERRIEEVADLKEQWEEERERCRILKVKLDEAEGAAANAEEEKDRATGELHARSSEWEDREKGLHRRLDDSRRRDREARGRLSELEKSLQVAERYLEVKIGEVKSKKKEIKRLREDLAVQTKALTKQREECRRMLEEARDAKQSMVEVRAAYVDIESPSKMSLKKVRRVVSRRVEEEAQRAERAEEGHLVRNLSLAESNSPPPVSPKDHTKGSTRIMGFNNSLKLRRDDDAIASGHYNVVKGSTLAKGATADEGAAGTSQIIQEVESLRDRVQTLEAMLSRRDSELSELTLRLNSTTRQNDGYRSLLTGRAMGLILAAEHRRLFRNQLPSSSSEAQDLLLNTIVGRSVDTCDRTKVRDQESGKAPVGELAARGAESAEGNTDGAGGAPPTKPFPLFRGRPGSCPKLSGSCTIIGTGKGAKMRLRKTLLSRRPERLFTCSSATRWATPPPPNCPGMDVSVDLDNGRQVLRRSALMSLGPEKTTVGRGGGEGTISIEEILIARSAANQ